MTHHTTENNTIYPYGYELKVFQVTLWPLDPLHKGPVMPRFDVFFAVGWNKLLKKTVQLRMILDPMKIMWSPWNDL